MTCTTSWRYGLWVRSRHVQTSRMNSCVRLFVGLEMRMCGRRCVAKNDAWGGGSDGRWGGKGRNLDTRMGVVSANEFCVYFDAGSSSESSGEGRERLHNQDPADHELLWCVHRPHAGTYQVTLGRLYHGFLARL